jgi:hydrogenase maturation protease
VGGSLSGKKISADQHPDILILGIGNILMGDEGVGVHVVRYLETLPVPENTALLDGGTGSLVLLEPMQLARKVIIIDATIDGQASGTVSLIRPKFSADYPKTLTAHDIGLKDLLDVFHLLGKQPDVTLCAISIAKMDEVRTDMSEELESKIPEFAEIVLGEIKKHL